MQSFLTFITLFGLSFFIWGSVGLCRYAVENFKYFSGEGLLKISVIPIGALLSLLVFWFSLESTLSFVTKLIHSWNIAGVNIATITMVIIPVWVVTCGVICGYLVTRLFDIRSFMAFIGLFGGVYAIGVIYLMSILQETELIFIGTDVNFFIVSLSFISAWFGLRFAGRTMSNKYSSDCPPSFDSSNEIRLGDVAVLVPAHNEENTIGSCLDSLEKVIPVNQIFVGSDGSTDKTVDIVTQYGGNVVDIQPNRGKAGTLQYLIEHFSICDHYKAVLILDADSEIDEQYLNCALPLFNDPEVVAIAGHAIPKWYQHNYPRWAMFFIAYRVRLYKLTQAILRYGQTWRHVNVSFIVPGFASMYRCSVLPNIDIAAKGLIIEDFNMTFELHHKHLGKIAYIPQVRCICHEPYNLTDYIKQVRRWYLGFWQTVRLHGFWSSIFWLALGAFIFEMLMQSFIFITVPFVLVWLVWPSIESITLWLPYIGLADIKLSHVVIGVFITDYVLTMLVAVAEKKPMLMFYGLGFFVLRWIDAFLFIFTLPLTFFVKSNGTWVSPLRA